MLRCAACWLALVLVTPAHAAEVDAELVLGSRDRRLFDAVKATLATPDAGVRVAETAPARNPRATSELFYRRGFERQARALAARLEPILGAAPVRPWPDARSPGAGVVVVVGALKLASPTALARVDNASDRHCVLAVRADGTKARRCTQPEDDDCTLRVQTLERERELAALLSTDLRLALVTLVCAPGGRVQELHLLLFVETGTLRFSAEVEPVFKGDLAFAHFDGVGADEVLVSGAQRIPVAQLLSLGARERTLNGQQAVSLPSSTGS